MAVSIHPTFLARGIAHDALLAQYRNGDYDHLMPKLPRMKSFKDTPIVDPLFESTSDDPVFYRKDQNGNKWVVASTGVQPKKKKYICSNCKSRFSHNPVGYPVKYQMIPILKKSVYRIIHLFWVEDYFCDFECMLGYVRSYRRLSGLSRYIDSTVIEPDIHFMYRLVTKDKTAILKPATNPKLVDKNGGPLKMEEWKNETDIYISTSNVKLLQTSVEHIKK